MIQTYLLKRVLEELDRAEQSPNQQERSVHLRACRYYSSMLQVLDRCATADASRGVEFKMD